jgi:hypothetical protein
MLEQFKWSVFIIAWHLCQGVPPIYFYNVLYHIGSWYSELSDYSIRKYFMFKDIIFWFWLDSFYRILIVDWICVGSSFRRNSVRYVYRNQNCVRD